MSFMDKTKNKNNCYTIGSGTAKPSYQMRTGGAYGWICPVCGRGLSPTTSYCPCNGWGNWNRWPEWWRTYPIWCGTTYTTTAATSGINNNETITINEVRS